MTQPHYGNSTEDTECLMGVDCPRCPEQAPSRDKPCDGEGHIAPKDITPFRNNTFKNPYGDFQAWTNRFLMDDVRETFLPKDDIFQVKRILDDAGCRHSNTKYVLLRWHERQRGDTVNVS